jgi:hypothetical protein
MPSDAYMCHRLLALLGLYIEHDVSFSTHGILELRTKRLWFALDEGEVWKMLLLGDAWLKGGHRLVH